MKKKKRPSIQPKHIFTFLAALCIVLIIATSVSNGGNILRGGFNTLLMPMQKGFNLVGGGIFNRADNLIHLHNVEKENEQLKDELAELKEQNTRYQLELTELAEYRSLLMLAEQYPDYETVGAHIIGKNSDNWYKTIMVDKGSRDGIAVDMNVIADGGLVGIVTSVTPATATISTIINDNRNVGAMALNSKDACIVTGDLSLYEKGLLSLSRIAKDDDINNDDKIVTSNTSTMYMPGILIGYASELTVDPNNLTKSGYLIPVVDFTHLDSVLIITSVKEGSSGGTEETAPEDAEGETAAETTTEAAAEEAGQ